MPDAMKRRTPLAAHLIRAVAVEAPADPRTILLIERWNGYEALEARLAEAEELLRGLEWAGQTEDWPSYCVVCDKDDVDGHAPDCRLAKWLEGT